jgi:hypothetical protein
MLRVLIRDARGATSARRTYASAYGYYTTSGGGGNRSTKTAGGGSTTSSRNENEKDDVFEVPKLTAAISKRSANTRIVTITSGGTKKGMATAMTTSRRRTGDSNVELGTESASKLCVDDNNDYHDDHSECGILGGADHAHAEALKMGGIVQTSKFQIKYDKREDVPSREGA